MKQSNHAGELVENLSLYVEQTFKFQQQRGRETGSVSAFKTGRETLGSFHIYAVIPEQESHVHGLREDAECCLLECPCE